MNSDIHITEKPDWISWDDIKMCLSLAHENNRSKGIIMSHYQWPSSKIRDFIGNSGVFWVALDGLKTVATAAVVEKTGQAWYNCGRFAYICFDGVLPEYRGLGINRAMSQLREEKVKERGLDVLVLDTHYKNKRLQRIAIKNGYRFVSFFRASSRDHYSVVMAKWLSKCPYSLFYCRWRYIISKIKTIVTLKLIH